tara:strand:- start:767 stop:1603 length:837 start_codon:yes stop_codon:yes gene_type:complete
MKIKLLGLTLLLMSSSTFAQNTYSAAKEAKTATLNVAYLNNFPMAYKDAKGVNGIEVDILNSFQNWLSENKGIKVEFNLQGYTNFSEMIEVVKKGKPNFIGAGSIAITNERKEKLNFSAPYLKNTSILVSSGKLKTATTNEELKTIFADQKGAAVKNSVHSKYIENVSKKYGVELNVTYYNNTDEVLKALRSGDVSFAFLDVLSFWNFMKDSKEFYKIQKFVESENEYFGFAFPKDSDWNQPFNEFFETGFGFTATKEYRKVLEKYLGYEIIEKVELD